MDRGGGVSVLERRWFTLVAPAKAGAHNHRCLLWTEPWSPASCNTDFRGYGSRLKAGTTWVNSLFKFQTAENFSRLDPAAENRAMRTPTFAPRAFLWAYSVRQRIDPIYRLNPFCKRDHSVGASRLKLRKTSIDL